MTIIGALSSFRELGEMSPHKRACVHRTNQLRDGRRSVRRSWRRWGKASPAADVRENVVQT